ncbi:MAG: FG-GAP-like repeat-containing protein [Dehalogenimonas sp.]
MKKSLILILFLCVTLTQLVSNNTYSMGIHQHEILASSAAQIDLGQPSDSPGIPTIDITAQMLFAQNTSPGSFISGQTMSNSPSNDVALGDLNSDGFIDIFLANKNSADEAWLNDGSGTFALYWTSPHSSNSTAVALADVDNDNDLDAFIVRNGSNELLVNDGNGNFLSSGQTFGNADSTDVAAGDFNGDGYLDFVVANYDAANIIWLNSGDGSFGLPITLASSNNNSNGVAVGDLNDDGHIDIFIANIGTNEVRLNDGAGNFQSFWTSPNSKTSYGLALGDLNGDGYLDAFVANVNAANEIWFNNGNGSFSDSGQAIGGSVLSTGIALDDFDDDGDLDTFIANGIVANLDKVYINDGAGSFTDSSQLFPSNNSTSVALADLNNDGSIDAVVTGTYGAIVWFNALPGITVTVPTPGASWTIGSAQIISWISFNVNGNVSIEISYNNGNSWTTLAADTANDGIFEWTVTGAATTQALIKIIPLADGSLQGITGNFSLVHPAPSAFGDTYTIEQNSQLTINAVNGVLANDSYAGQEALTAQLVEQPSHGTLNLASNGSFTYTPDTDYYGSDTFIYQASNGDLTSNEAQVTITVSLTNNSPSAVNDDYTTQKNTPITVDAASGVLTNDTDSDNDILTAIVTTTPSNGIVEMNGNGSFIYTPVTDYSGTDSFSYQAFDGYEYSNNATVTINVEYNSPVIVQNPGDVSIVYGADAIFEASATGNPEPTIQWQESIDNGVTWSDIPGADGLSYLVDQPPVVLNGRQFRGVFSNIHGTVYTSAAMLSITPRPISVAADDTHKTYGDADPLLNYRLAEGSLVEGDLITGNLSRENGETVGSYEIVQGSLSLNSNYIMTFVEATFNIDSRIASVTPDNKSKFVGESDPTLTGTLSGFLSEDNVNVNFSRSSGEIIGVYEIVTELTPAEILTNYSITYHQGIFSIVENPAPVVISHPQNQTLTYGDNAVFTAIAAGNPAPSIQWQFSADDGMIWENVVGESGNSITIISPKMTKNGYQYRALSTNEHGTATSEPALLTINPKIVTPNVTIADKTYDGTMIAEITSLYLSGYLEPDAITLAGGVAVFDSSAVGDEKTVRVTGLYLTGSDTANYHLSSEETIAYAAILSPVFNGGEFGGSKITGAGFFGTLPFVGEDGLTVTSGLATTDNGQLSLLIGPGTSVTNPSSVESITVSASIFEEPPVSPPDHTLLLAYELGPGGTTFNPAITLIWHFDELVLPENTPQNEMIVTFWNGTAWVEMASTIDLATKTIAAQTSHFSIFGLMVPASVNEGNETPVTEPAAETPNNKPDPTDGATAPSTNPSYPDVVTEPNDFDYRYPLAAFIGALFVGLIVLLTRPRLY